MDTTAASKRKRLNGPDVDEEDSGDSVIGLDVGGQLFYTHKSTLTAGSTYFAARFGGSFSAGACRKDECGRDVYFVDADGKLFEHILAYLRRGVPSWPDRGDDPKLHRRLVAEAEYFGVEAMLVELQNFASIAPNASGKGVLYWLGTGGFKENYQNPCKNNLIEVGPPPNEVSRGGKQSMTRQQISDFFQYRPPCDSGPDNECAMLFCPLKNGLSRCFNFVAVVVKPTHYSLRYGQCYGMSDWNFEASSDGVNWDVLHKARKERYLLKPSDEELFELAEVEDADIISIVENRHRKTWKVNSPLFYKFFRFVSVCRDELRNMYGEATSRKVVETLGEDGRILFSRCLHGVGFELYGDVKYAK